MLPHRLLALSCGMGIWPGCTAPEVPRAAVERTVLTMGTRLVVRTAGAGSEAAAEACVRAILAADARFSSYREDSQLARLHRAAPGQQVPVDAAFRFGLAAARRWSAVAHGAFDPGIGRLLEVWGVRQGGRRTEPTSDELREARAESGVGHFVQHAHAVSRHTPGAKLAEGGFVKGLALDAALAAATAHARLESVCLDLGGQLAWHSVKRHRAGIAHPRERERAVAWVDLPRAGSLATTGNSERGILVGHARRSHVLDPRTGAPVADWGSVTVLVSDPVADPGCAADCLSTALYVLGPAAGLRLARRLRGVEALFLEFAEPGLRWHMTRGMRNRLATIPQS